MTSLRKLEFLRRIAEKILIEPGSGCWMWQGARTDAGYGVMCGPDGKHTTAQRICYELLIGPIRKGWELDHGSKHGCRRRGCIHPLHVEPCSHWLNMRRGGNAEKTHCRHGHPFDEANTYRDGSGRRYCRACGRISALKRYYRKLGREHAL
jgi:hypothetical protein